MRLGAGRSLCAEQCLASVRGIEVETVVSPQHSCSDLPCPFLSADTLAFFSRNLYFLNLTKPSSFGVGMQELPPSLMDALERSFLPENRRLNGEHQPITQPAFLLLMLSREEGSSQLLPTK